MDHPETAVHHLEKAIKPISGWGPLVLLIATTLLAVIMFFSGVVNAERLGPILTGIICVGGVIVLLASIVGMVQMALDHLSERKIVELDDERRAAMVSNLLVVLCSDRHTQPVVNAGSLY